MTATGDYTRQIPISTTPEKVFDTLTTAAQFASWWPTSPRELAVP